LMPDVFKSGFFCYLFATSLKFLTRIGIGKRLKLHTQPKL